MSALVARKLGPVTAGGGAPARGVRTLLRAASRLLGLAEPARVELSLADGVAWSGRVGGGGATVLCASGSAWLTLEGDPEDRILVAGQAFGTTAPGRLAVLALGPARLVVSGDVRA